MIKLHLFGGEQRVERPDSLDLFFYKLEQEDRQIAAEQYVQLGPEGQPCIHCGTFFVPQDEYRVECDDCYIPF